MSTDSRERIIKKYPNRRLYDTAISRYITLDAVRELVKNSVKFRVVDAKTEEDLTRSVLLQLILEQEEKKQAIFATELLEQIVRAYGDAMQSFMALYLKESLEVFLKQQTLMQEQMTHLIQTAPLSVFTELTRQNLRLWQSMQESFLQSRKEPKGDGGGGPQGG
jgi:polyhydroxyalkanoate synthesis repressor PhaR